MTLSKKILVSFLFVFFATGAVFATNSVQAADMYRVYNPNSGEHFYTADWNEKMHLIDVGWRDEGIGWVAPETGDPVYRMYNPNAGGHHYTLSAYERDFLVGKGWRYEGICWQSDSSQTLPLYRAYNPNGGAATHHYTPDYNEFRHLISVGWRDEGISWYGIGYGMNYESLTARIIHEKVNQLRTSVGVPVLNYDSRLVQAAKVRSDEITTYFDHTRPDGRSYSTAATEAGYNSSYIGENIAATYSRNASADDLAEEFYQMWKESPGHYNNMVRDMFSDIGVGVSRVDNYYYASQLFGKPY